jgi:hypothetical protein
MRLSEKLRTNATHAEIRCRMDVAANSAVVRWMRGISYRSGPPSVGGDCAAKRSARNRPPLRRGLVRMRINKSLALFYHYASALGPCSRL